jgi:hypothetical protein|tara:strand:+ start:354 stop:1172 length:819 start_codon:yes stop_codon:yes gene_type:complete
MKIRRKDDTKTGLYSRGGLFQFFDATNKTQKINTYVGPYHLKNNVAYVGAEPRPGAKKLRKIVRNQDVFTYNKLNSKYAKKFTGVVSSPPTITAKNEEAGFFVRYFVKQLSNNIITEVNKQTYKEVNKQKTPHHKLYSALELDWKISGPIFNRLYRGNIIESGIIPTNNKSLSQAEDTMPGISQYIIDALQYGNPREDSSLYTPGDQLITENGEEYFGYYHIHMNRPMVGKYHTNQDHEYLEPLSETIFDVELKTEEEKIIQTTVKTYNSLQ